VGNVKNTGAALISPLDTGEPPDRSLIGRRGSEPVRCDRREPIQTSRSRQTTTGQKQSLAQD
jgi:hypothetical protein